VVVMATGSLSASKIVSQQEFIWFVFTPWGFTAFVIFFIGALAETNRSPFDLPEAESEIIAGYFTEYSGFKFALFFLGEYIAMFAISGLAVTLFLGGGNGPGSDNAWIACVWFLAKLFGLIAVMIWLRGTLPRLRVDQLMAFAWKFLLPLSLLNIFVTGASLHLLGGGDLAGITERNENLFFKAYAANPFVVVAAWIVAGTVLYFVATGLDKLTRSNARPRKKLYFTE